MRFTFIQEKIKHYGTANNQGLGLVHASAITKFIEYSFNTGYSYISVVTI